MILLFWFSFKLNIGFILLILRRNVTTYSEI